MWGKGKSVGHSQSRTCSGRMKLKRCKNNGEADNVVLIDVDSDNLNNVIIIDVPESLKRKLRGSSVPRKDKKCQLRTIIYVDDDENSDSNHPGQGVEGDGEFYNDASSSGEFCRASNHTRNTLDAVGDECQFVEESLSPLRLSKCKRTYSGKTSSRNRYGLGPKSDGDSSDYDCPDHEFMEDSFGKLREQWEKANMKKKIDVRNGQSVRPDQATTSGSHTGTQQKVEVENQTDQYTETQTSPSSRNARYQEKSSPFVQAADGNLASTSNNSKKAPADFGLKTTQENYHSNNKDNYRDRGESVSVDPALNNNEGKTNNNLDHGSSGFVNEEYHCSPESSLCSSRKRGNKQVKHAKKTFQEKEKTMPPESCIPNLEPTVDIDFGCTEASLSDEAVPFFRTQHSVETEDDHGREKLQKASSCKSCFPNESEDTSRSVDKEKLVYGEPMQNIKPSNEMLVNGSVPDNEVGAVQKKTFCEGPPLGKSGIEKQSGCCRGIPKPVPEEPSLCSCFHYGMHTDLYLRVREHTGEFLANNRQEDKDGPLHDQELLHAKDRDTNAVQGSIINERENLKETDEYKRAVEEEWASRQREIQLQAEEAQKLRLLRKREKAESMRLLDMERRQKQRVEEMREIQKKDEENMNLKELLRAEIRKELNELEITCQDMASLLRGLGIQVGSGFQPLPHEVRAAYKRALLSFHPDRASGSDIRQLVEAEEKFKLISRMKEKFLSTS